MLNLRKIIRILPITFIFMYAIGVFGLMTGIASRNSEFSEIAKLFTTYSLIPAFLVTVIYSFIHIENKSTKLILYTILFIIGTGGLFFYIRSNDIGTLEMMQNFVLFPILFISVLGIVYYELKYLKE